MIDDFLVWVSVGLMAIIVGVMLIVIVANWNVERGRNVVLDLFGLRDGSNAVYDLVSVEVGKGVTGSFRGYHMVKVTYIVVDGGVRRTFYIRLEKAVEIGMIDLDVLGSCISHGEDGKG